MNTLLSHTVGSIVAGALALSAGFGALPEINAPADTATGISLAARSTSLSVKTCKYIKDCEKPLFQHHQVVFRLDGQGIAGLIHTSPGGDVRFRQLPYTSSAEVGYPVPHLELRYSGGRVTNVTCTITVDTVLVESSSNSGCVKGLSTNVSYDPNSGWSAR